jgi:hypothetical protein
MLSFLELLRCELKGLVVTMGKIRSAYEGSTLPEAKLKKKDHGTES